MDKQVSKGHYIFGNYLQKSRWISYWHQLDEILRLSPESVLIIGPGDHIVKKVLDDYIPVVKTLDFDENLHPDYVCSVTECSRKVERKFDCVVCCQVLEHLPFEKFESCIRSIYEITDKNCVISLPVRRWTFGGSLIFFNKVLTGRLVWKRCRVKWKFDGQHYWEIGTKGSGENEIRCVLMKYFHIRRRFFASGSTYHYFYILEKK